MYCGTVHEAGYPYVYYRPYTDKPFYRAGDCDEIIALNKKKSGVNPGYERPSINRVPGWIERDMEFIKAYLENQENKLKNMAHKAISDFESQARKDIVEQRERDDADDDARKYQIREEIKNRELYR